MSSAEKKLPEWADLSAAQRAVVESWGQGLAVSAGAGSGKTTTLTVKCAELLRRDPQARLCAVSFTERSASDLRVKLSERLAVLGRSLSGEGSLATGHWVMTIHGLCGTILRENPAEAGFEGDESVLSEAEARALWERACEILWLDELPQHLEAPLARLLDRESRDTLLSLLARVRSLPRSKIYADLENSGDQASQDLACLARHVIERYEKQKRRRGAIDFEDLERGAAQALRHEGVRARYHRRFSLVLVDECQDTNPTQSEIILLFAKPDRSNLCVVGDAKQSIYRFRDADVTAFERLCALLPVRIELTENYRSRPGILEFTNQVCEPLFEASGLRYESLVPRREAGAEPPVVRLNLQTPEAFAAWVCAENARGVPWGEMALLLRQVRGSGEKWLTALSRAGIPIAIGSGGFFWRDPRVRELVSFLKWWNSPDQRLSAITFLRSPWIGISDVELDRWRTQDPTYRRPFLGSDHWAALCLRELDSHVLRPGQWLQRLMAAAPAEEEQDLGLAWLGLWHRLEDLSSRGLETTEAIRELAQACEAGAREREVPPPRSLGQLSVLTVHASKGLEFPHVFLVDFPPKPNRAPNAPLLFWLPGQDSLGARLGRRDPSGERDKKAETEWRGEELRRDLAEQKRVFYVALTRAQERVVLACVGDAPEDPIEDVLERDYWRGWVEPHSRRWVQEPAPPSEREGPSAPTLGTQDRRAEAPIPEGRLALRRVRPRHSVSEWNLLSRCERAYVWSVQGEPSPEEIEAPFPTRKRGARASPTLSAPEIGTRVHECLERLDWESLQALETEVGSERISATQIRRWAESSDWMSGDVTGFWKELGFEARVGGETLVGAMDRVVLRDDVYSVVDFKVVREFKPDDELLRTYQGQINLYAWALGQLEPGARDRSQAVLIQIAPEGVRETRAPLGDYAGLQARVEALAGSAAALLGGQQEPVPAPGTPCFSCAFRGHCDVALGNP